MVTALVGLACFVCGFMIGGWAFCNFSQLALKDDRE
jgi:hypothetical protein